MRRVRERERERERERRRAHFMTDDVIHNSWSQVWSNGVPKLVHRHNILIDLEGQIDTAETETRGEERGTAASVVLN